MASLVFYLRVITDKPDIDESFFWEKKKKELEEVMAIKETHKVIP